MPTNLDLDDRLIDEARRLGHHKTEKHAVSAALREYIKRHRQRGIVELFGTIDYDPRWDYKAARRRGATRGCSSTPASDRWRCGGAAGR